MKIFILDDHPLLRRGLGQLINLEPDLEIVGESANAIEALEIIETVKPDLIVVDINLDGPNGIEFIKMAKEKYPGLRFLVHSMHDEMLYAERALRAGARGYMMKHEKPSLVIYAIRHVLNGQIYLSDAMRERMLKHQYHGDEAVTPLETLSDRELEVFQFIGKGETTVRIAALLHRSSKTIETCRSRIKEKLYLKDNMELIRRAVQWNQEYWDDFEKENLSGSRPMHLV